MNVFTDKFIESVAEITSSNDGDVIYTKGVILEVKERGYSKDDAKYVLEVIKTLHPDAELIKG